MKKSESYASYYIFKSFLLSAGAVHVALPYISCMLKNNQQAATTTPVYPNVAQQFNISLDAEHSLYV